MLDKSFCAKPDKWLWPTTAVIVQTQLFSVVQIPPSSQGVVTQTHLSRIAQKSLSVLCRGSLPMLTKKQNISFKGPTRY